MSALHRAPDTTRPEGTGVYAWQRNGVGTNLEVVKLSPREIGRGETLGVTTGKFLPYHLGHRLLIEEASAGCDRLCVIVAGREGDRPPAGERARWIAQDRNLRRRAVDVVAVTEPLPNQSEAWGEYTLALTAELYGRSPDRVFTSEPYGETWAEEMGAEHRMVDQARSATADQDGPISGTRIRNYTAQNLHLLAEPARAALVDRVVLVGAESTGKTTLAQELARRYETVWVPEIGRTWWEARQTATPDGAQMSGGGWSVGDFVAIAEMQAALEDRLAEQSPGAVLICDTDPAVTALWGRRYLLDETARRRGGPRHLTDADLREADRALEEVWELARLRQPRLYVACAADFGHVDDGTRESRHWQEVMGVWTRDWLTQTATRGVPWVEAGGPLAERTAATTAEIDQLGTIQFVNAAEDGGSTGTGKKNGERA